MEKSKNCLNLKTNWYKHLYYISSNLCMSYLIYLAFKSAKGQKWAKMASKGIKNAIIYRPDFLLKHKIWLGRQKGASGRQKGA